MPFDFKKEYKEYYQPANKPSIITVPEMKFIAVRGKGNPNDPDGEYSKALNLLYGIAYTIKMSKKGSHVIEGYYDYVVPPLEGFWWQDGVLGVDYSHKENFNWISVMRAKQLAPEIECGFLYEGQKHGRLAFQAKEAGIQYLHPDFALLDDQAVEECRKCGIGLNVWTVNTEERMKQLIEWDVNSVISNYPDMCLRLLK